MTLLSYLFHIERGSKLSSEFRSYSLVELSAQESTSVVISHPMRFNPIDSQTGDWQIFKDKMIAVAACWLGVNSRNSEFRCMYLQNCLAVCPIYLVALSSS